MGKNDMVVRTPQDLERKYNFAQLLGLKRNIEITSQGMVKIENELNSMLNAIVINLKDVLDSQSDISLWFYSGTPTTSNEPYTNWTDPNEHLGDIYYDRSSGKVYQWNKVWEVNTSPDLVEAMAITNSEVDVTGSHERKVFFATPTIPYTNGDWWIKDDGSLYVCQISKTTGLFEDNDFISSNNYTESIAEKIGDEIKVLKGTITTMSESYAKFTDLATGGSTTISGDNITTGAIKSENYVSGTSGMKIDLDSGTMDSKNLKLKNNGDLEIGGYIKTDKGILTNLQFASDKNFLGQNQVEHEGTSIDINSSALAIYVTLPEGFKIESAKVTLKTFKTENTYMDDLGNDVTNYGKVQNIRLYKEKTSAEMINHWYYVGAVMPTGVEEISGAFGSSGFNPSTTEGTSVQSEELKTNLNNEQSVVLWVRTADSTAGVVEATKQTQYAYAILDILGYYKLA